MTHTEFNCNILSKSDCGITSGCHVCNDFNGIFGMCCNSGETCNKNMGECEGSSITKCEENCGASPGCDEQTSNTGCCLGCYNVDITGDGKVDARDIALVARAYGSKQGPPPSRNWDPKADINKDGKVDAKDVAGIASKFGVKCEAPTTGTTSTKVGLTLAYTSILFIIIALIIVIVIVFVAFRFFAKKT
jgi:hypothetical protein